MDCSIGNSPGLAAVMPLEQQLVKALPFGIAAGGNKSRASHVYVFWLPFHTKESSLRKAVMDITTVVIWAIAVLCIVVCWFAVRRDKQDTTPRQGEFALRDSAAIALSNYWSHYYEGWSLVLFRDISGVIRHVACGIPDGRFFDAGGYCNEDQIAHRLGIRVTAENCDEADAQSLLGPNNAVLEAAEESRHFVERKAP